jgi:hypothetical protein
MLAAFLLVGLVTAPLASAALFWPGDRPHRVVGPVPAARRLLLALLGTGLLMLAGFARMLQVPPERAAVAVLVFGATSAA